MIVEATMPPGPTETVTQETGIRYPSLGLKSLGASANSCLSNPKNMEQTSLLKGNSSIGSYTSGKLYLQKNLTKLQAGCPPSQPYASHFFLSPSEMNVQNKGISKSKLEKTNFRHRFCTNGDTRPLFAEKKVKRELFPGTVSQVLADVNKLWDLSVTEAEGMHGSPGPKYRLNGRIEGECLSVPLANNYSSPVIPDLEQRPQMLSNKESQVKSSFMRCINQQQVLLNRAERNKKRLQMLLTNHVAEHCRQQISDFVNYQTRKAKWHSDSISQLSDDTNMNLEGADSPSVMHQVVHASSSTSSTCINMSNQDFENIKSPSEMEKFSVAMPGILTSFERQLDSDATGSSSDEDWDGKYEKTYNCKTELSWLSMRANVGSRWAWLQAKVSDLENQIQQLGHLQSLLQNQKRTLLFEEPSYSIFPKEKHLPESSNFLRSLDRLATPPEDTSLSSTKDLEMSPSSPTMLLRNIEKQSVQLTEMVSSLMTSFPMSPKPYNKPLNREYRTSEFSSVNRIPVHKTESSIVNGFSQKQPKKERKRINGKVPSTFGSSSARTRPLQLYHKRNLYSFGSGCTAMLSHKDVYCCNESLQTSNHCSTRTCCDKLQKPVLEKGNVCEIEPHFHSVLSLPCDLPLQLYLGALLKSNREIGENTVENTLFIQKEDGCHPHYANNSYPINVTPKSFYDSCKDERSTTTANDFDKVTLNTISNDTQTEDTSLMTPTSQKSSQISDPSIMVSGTRRRRESSYDIDNIVIPMNLVSPIRLEKLQYKEILTPRFKEMVYEPLEIPPDEELEDLSDDAFSRRHEKYEQSEKARWSFWQQNKWPKKSRSSGHGFAVWSGKVFPSNEENYSPGYISPGYCDLPSPDTNKSQNQHTSDELQHDQLTVNNKR